MAPAHGRCDAPGAWRGAGGMQRRTRLCTRRPEPSRVPAAQCNLPPTLAVIAAPGCAQAEVLLAAPLALARFSDHGAAVGCGAGQGGGGGVRRRQWRREQTWLLHSAGALEHKTLLLSGVWSLLTSKSHGTLRASDAGGSRWHSNRDTYEALLVLVGRDSESQLRSWDQGVQTGTCRA